MNFDVVIIGAGPAGISASLYVKRAGYKVLVLYHGESQLEKAHKIENFYGFVDGITGSDLYKNGIQQAKNLGIEVKDQEVTGIEVLSYGENPLYSVKSTTSEYTAPVVIIAAGNKKLRPPVKNLVEFEGRGVSYCAVCDGFFYRKKKTCVIGNKNFALEEARYLSNLAEKVTILTNGLSSGEIDSLLDGSNIKLDTRKILEIEGNEKVTAVRFDDGTSLSVDGIFVALGEAGGADFAKKIGLLLNGDSITVNEKMCTSAKGIFSCGNVNGGLLQVSKAVYEGAVAGLSAVDYLKNLENPAQSTAQSTAE